MEHLCAPGGQIKIITGGSIHSIAFMAHGTKWENQILAYFEKQYKKAKNRKSLITKEKYLSKKEKNFYKKNHYRYKWEYMLDSYKRKYDDDIMSIGTIILKN